MIFFLDIADKWSPNSNDNDEHLPKGIVTSLKKVTMADGCLTFERFCAGLKIAILRHESEKKKSKHQKNNSSFVSTSKVIINIKMLNWQFVEFVANRALFIQKI